MKKRRKTRLLIPVILLIIGLVPIVIIYFFRTPEISNLEPVEPPAGAQLLIFPIRSGVITAGYRDAKYLEKNGYPHYGIDITSPSGGRADVLASGDGVVLGTEFCDNSLGHIAVIRYDNVFVPQTGETVSLIARYYHMTTSLLNTNDAVAAGQLIGEIDGGHKWYHHIHMELDADLEYPFNTPQVAEASSKLLNRYPATGNGTLEPIWVLVAEKKQQVTVHPHSDCCTEKDEPRFTKK